MVFSSIWPIDRTLSGATTLSQSWTGIYCIKGLLRILQNSCITETTLSECLVLYLGHSLGWGSYSSAEWQSEYSTAPADWAILSIRYVLLRSIRTDNFRPICIWRLQVVFILEIQTSPSSHNFSLNIRLIQSSLFIDSFNNVIQDLFFSWVSFS